ncbi:MAG: hypothetical protein HZC37_09685 [Burkholderiales bacterium]|nr:hypothetical protein [Burkholderiales bacterium]
MTRRTLRSPLLSLPLAFAMAACLGPVAPAFASDAAERALEAAIGAREGHTFDAALRSTLVAASDAARIELDRELHGDAGSHGAAGSERVVKGAPYCAEAVHENVQWLPDPGGAAPNRIVRQNTTRLCRDGEGRTRQEVERGGRRYVYLRDPVAREGWVLDTQRKTARRLSGAALPLDAVADAASWRDYSEQMREWARATAEAARAQARAHAGPHAAAQAGIQAGAQARPEPAAGGGASVPLATPAAPAAPPAPPAPPLPPLPTPPSAAGPVPPVPAVISRVERSGPRDAEVTVLRMERDGPRWDFPAPPPAVQWRATHLAPRGQGTLTALPARDFDGVRAHGERTTWTIEAGRVGNERPIQIVREVWTAPELLLTVSSRDFDPRSGEVNYRLRNLKRGEPDAELMRVPADYTRQERGAPRGGGASAPRG